MKRRLKNAGPRASLEAVQNFAGRGAGASIILILAVALIAPAAAQAKVHAPPNLPCNFEHRMDIAIVDGVWFECSCEALMVGTVCDWYEITSPAPDPRRHIKRPVKHKRLIPVLTIVRVPR